MATHDYKHSTYTAEIAMRVVILSPVKLGHLPSSHGANYELALIFAEEGGETKKQVELSMCYIMGMKKGCCCCCGSSGGG
jgi:hypothetical protein